MAKFIRRKFGNLADAEREAAFILAIIKNVHQVSLEAGNSPNMVFAHYRQLVRESEAAEWWFAIKPATQPGAGEIIPMPATPTVSAVPEIANKIAAPVAAAPQPESILRNR